jgi:large subunit ribosomal protein L21
VLGPLSDDGFGAGLDLATFGGAGGASTGSAAAPSPATVGLLEPDDIEAILGIGPVIGAHLREQGITTFAQIAAWTPEDVARIGDEIDFPGRAEREHWVEQARELQARKYGN